MKQSQESWNRATKNLIEMVVVGLIAVVFISVGLSSCQGSVPEDQYIDMLDDGDKTADETRVTITVDHIVNTKTVLGWAIYGTHGGIWMSPKNPHVNVGDTIIVKPTSEDNSHGNWAFTYRMIQR